MEFGLDQLRTGLRPGSSRFELSRHVEIARTCSNLVADRFEAKSHYAILVVDRSEELVAELLACASSLLVIGQIPARCRSATSFGSVRDQDSLIEFGFYMTAVRTHRLMMAPILTGDVLLLMMLLIDTAMAVK